MRHAMSYGWDKKCPHLGDSLFMDVIILGGVYKYIVCLHVYGCN